MWGLNFRVSTTLATVDELAGGISNASHSGSTRVLSARGYREKHFGPVLLVNVVETLAINPNILR
jgi:hypothetical protein